MNFLAHLHLASLAESSLLGNLLADFVRGNPQDSYSPDVVAGIRMHRRVDMFIDSTPEVRACRQLFSRDTRRTAPIILDMVWDHFLSLHWDKIEPTHKLSDFTYQAQSAITPHLLTTPERFQNLNRYLWQDRWLERYADLTFLERALRGMASRRPRLSALADSMPEIKDNYMVFEDMFWQLYPRIILLAKEKSL